MNGGIIGKRSTTRRGVWLPEDVVCQTNGLRIADVTSGLVHRYPLTVDANDVIGTAHLTNNNAVSFSEVGASFLTASAQYLSVSLQMPTVFTWSWFFNVPPPGAGVKYCMVGSASSIVANAILAKIQPGPVLTTYVTNTGTPSDKSNDISLTGTHHLALSGKRAQSTNDITTVYLDGQVAMWLKNTGGSFTLDNNFSIGRVGAYAGDYLTGVVRDFRIYERALTLAEILSLARRG